MKTVSILIVALLCQGTTRTRGIALPTEGRGRHIKNELQILKPIRRIIVPPHTRASLIEKELQMLKPGLKLVMLKPIRRIIVPPQTRVSLIEKELQMLKPGLKLVIVKDEEKRDDGRGLVPSWFWDLFNKKRI